MKCIIAKDGVIKRVRDAEADEKVKTGEWKFASKTQWKNIIYGLDDKVRKEFPANVKESPEFNRANADALKADEKSKKAGKELKKKENRQKKIAKQ